MVPGCCGSRADRDGAAKQLGPAFGLAADEVLRSPHAVVGPVDEICDHLRRQRDELGISYLGVSAEAADALAPASERLTGT